VVNKQVIKDDYAIYNGDCIEVIKSIPDESIHLTCYSPPFGGLYHYSSDSRDMSNNDSYEDFFKHYEYLVKEKYRITMKGRMTCVHCCDIPTGNSGTDHIIDFPGDIIRLHEKHGFNYMSRFCIWKEPFKVRMRTMAKNLAHKTIVDDSLKCGNGGADYLLVFRKKGDSPVLVKHPTGLEDYAGEREIPNELMKYKNYKGSQIENRYSHWIWRQYASSFWDDIRIDNVLPFKDSRDEDDEKHVHPLQLDVIERCVVLWSNEGETILTPFMGVGSEVYVPVMKNRKAIGIELKESYFNQAVLNMEKAIENRKAKQKDLFS
jgi:DNA modification methylase